MISITRPSRGERWSAATTRQTGSLRPPMRVRRRRTAMTAAQPSGSALLHQRGEVRHPPLADLLHELAHLPELLDQRVDLLDVGPRSLGDPQAPRALDDVRAPALLGRHRRDDRLDAVDLALVD